MAQIGLGVLALGLLFLGVQGLRGVPDSTGKKTSTGVAVTCIVLAVGLLVFAFAVLPNLF